VKEGRERVRVALKNSGFHFSAKRITVNRVPAGVKKEGVGLDVAIAVGILVTEEVIAQEALSRCVLIGKLSLDGCVKPIIGSLVFGLACRKWFESLWSAQNGLESSLVDGVCIQSIRAPRP